MRILLTLALGLFSIGTNAQSFQAVEGTDVQYYPSANGFMDCAIHLKNLTQSPIILQYKKVSVDFPSTWDISFCDNRNCFGGFVDEDTMSAIAPDDEKNSLKLSVFPNGKSDTAVVVYEVWNKYTPADKITLTYTIMVRWGASMESYEVVTMVSPNPANDYVQLPVGAAQLLDVQGRIVSNTTTGSLNLLEVPNGIYFVRFLQNNAWVNQKLVVKH
jgi:hypothetical protein